MERETSRKALTRRFDAAVKVIQGKVISENARIEIVYSGKEVRDGTLTIPDMVDALQGFGSAYSKVVDFGNFGGSHHLRVKGLRRGSADIVLAVVRLASENKELFEGGSVLVTTVVSAIAGVIKLKKRISASDHPSFDLSGNKGTVNIHIGDTKIEVPKFHYELFRSRALDGDLDRLTRPLEAGKVDQVELREDKRVLEDSRISAAERPLFEYSASEIAKTRRDVQLRGRFVSLNKESNQGTFRLIRGRGVPYKFVGPDPTAHWKYFTLKSEVTITCTAHFDESLNPVRLEISEVEPVQGDMGDSLERFRERDS